MSIPKEPRQIMINLMYLVLTALLALNVSNEILNAFRTLSSSIDKSNVSIDQRNIDLYNQIKENEKQAGQADKVRPYRERADAVVAEADKMVAYLEKWKKDVVLEAGGYSKTDPKFPDRMDNIDATTDLLVEKKGGNEIKDRISNLRTFLLGQVSANDASEIGPLMPLKIEPAAKDPDHNPTGDWSIGNFEHMPAIAALALFSKYENDVRSSEALVISRLFEEAHAKDLKFDTSIAIAVPTQSYALVGDKIGAQILVGAFNKHNNPVISNLSQGTAKPPVNGVINWETTASGIGPQSVHGVLTLNGEAKQFEFKYTVGSTGASLQLDKMNVFYIGVPNPVTVSAAGYSLQDVYIDPIPNGTITGSLGHYLINMTKPGDITVNIMAKKKEGGTVSVGTSKIRVKYLPDPTAKLGDKSSGTMQAAIFRAQLGPIASMGADFLFDTKFKIVSLSFSEQPKGGEYQGPYTIKMDRGCLFTDNPSIIKLINRSRPGDRVYIEEIRAVGPDGRQRPLNPIILTLN